MEEFWRQEFELPKLVSFLTVLWRLIAAAILAGIVGINRERMHEAAGLRTHILVAVSAALFVMLVTVDGAASSADASRVIQGIAAGIGFVGGGAILRRGTEPQAHGLATAASIWLAAAIGVGVGTGRVWKSALAAILGWFTLSILGMFKKKAKRPG